MLHELPFDVQFHLLCFPEKSDLNRVLATCKTLRGLAHPDYLPLLKARLLHRQLLGKAASHGFVDVVRLMLKRPWQHRQLADALFMACKNNRVEVVRLLLQHQRHPAHGNIDGADNNALLLASASSRGQVEVVRLLLQHKGKGRPADNVDPSAIDDIPILRASSKGHMEVARLLLEHLCRPAHGNTDDADPRVQDMLLRSAIMNNNVNMARLLLQQGADPRAQDDAPLCSAITGDQVDMARLLLDHGADPRAQDDLPLYVATLCDNVGMARLLLER